MTGLGSVTLRWMIRKLKPRIDRSYPTLKDRRHTFIAGSSMGGLMSLYALLTYPDVFGGAAALSPSLWTEPEQIRALVRKARILPDSILYLDYGANELARDPVRRKEFTAVSSTLMRRGMNVTARIVPDGEHCEACWEKQVPFFVPTLLYHLNEEEEDVHGV